MLSKSTFIRGVQCDKSLYLHKKRPYLRDSLSPEIKAKFQRGHDVGKYARELFSGGLDLSPSSKRVSKKTVGLTASHIQNQTPILYEVPFWADDLVAILDILVFTNGKWQAYEVKSSLSISETYLLDITFQSHVISLFGLTNVDYFIIHINPDYILEHSIDIHDLFRIVNVNNEISKRIDIVKSKTEHLLQIEKLTQSPDISIGLHCDYPYICDFKGHCWKHLPKLSVFSIPGIPAEKQFQLYAENKFTVDEVVSALEGKLSENYSKSIFERKAIIEKDNISQFIPIQSKKQIFFKILYKKIPVPKYHLTKPFEITPFAVMLRINDEFVFTIFQDNENRWEQVYDFFLKYVFDADNTMFISFDNSHILSSVLLSLQRIFNIQHKIKVASFDIADVFAAGLYCSADFDTNLSFTSVNNHFKTVTSNVTNEDTIMNGIHQEFSNMNEISLSDFYQQGNHEMIETYLKWYVFSVLNMYQKLIGINKNE